jgi:hypothetical protein
VPLTPKRADERAALAVSGLMSQELLIGLAPLVRAAVGFPSTASNSALGGGTGAPQIWCSERSAASTLDGVSLTVHLPEELSRRVEALAAERNQTPEQVALEAIAAQLPARRRLSFSGIGSSGPGKGDIGQRHREIIAESLAAKTAREV